MRPQRDEIVIANGCEHRVPADSYFSDCKYCDCTYCSAECFDRHECRGHKPTERECEACGEWDETVIECVDNGIPYRVCRSCYSDEINNQAQKWGEHHVR